MDFCYHGSLATSSTSLLRELGIHDQGLRQAGKAASEAAEMSNCKEKTPACVQIMDIYLMFKIGDIANVSVKSVIKQHSILTV